MSKQYLTDYDESVIDLLKELGLYDTGCISVELKISPMSLVTLTTERYVKEKDIVAIKKYMSNFVLKDTVETE